MDGETALGKSGFAGPGIERVGLRPHAAQPLIVLRRDPKQREGMAGTADARLLEELNLRILQPGYAVAFDRDGIPV
jgi:hypothetical protein